MDRHSRDVSEKPHKSQNSLATEGTRLFYSELSKSDTIAALSPNELGAHALHTLCTAVRTGDRYVLLFLEATLARAENIEKLREEKQKYLTMYPQVENESEKKKDSEDETRDAPESRDSLSEKTFTKDAESTEKKASEEADEEEEEEESIMEAVD
jgi:flagellar biosynthesis GTPase FlhF